MTKRKLGTKSFGIAILLSIIAHYNFSQMIVAAVLIFLLIGGVLWGSGSE